MWGLMYMALFNDTRLLSRLVPDTCDRRKVGLLFFFVVVLIRIGMPEFYSGGVLLKLMSTVSGASHLGLVPNEPSFVLPLPPSATNIHSVPRCLRDVASGKTAPGKSKLPFAF